MYIKTKNKYVIILYVSIMSTNLTLGMRLTKKYNISFKLHKKL